MSVVLLILTNSTPSFSNSQTSQFKPHPSSGKYSAIACRSAGNNAPIQFSGNAATAARTFLSPTEIIGGNLRCNADIKISGNGFVNGDATPAPGHLVNKTGNATVTGSIQPATELIDCSIGDLTQLISWVQQNNNDSSVPPTDQGRMPWGCGSNPPPNDPWQFCLKGNETIHLSGGIYWFSSWSQSGNSKIIIDGYVRILVIGSIGLSGNLSINADGNPYNLLIFAIPDNSFSLQMSGNTIFNGLMYGPAITAQLSGQSIINGNLITQDINASGQAKLKRWIDETMPEINFTASTATCLNLQNITASLTITDNESGIDPESIYLYLDGNPITISANPADSSWHSANVQAELSGLSEGNHQLISKAWDRAGNMSQQSANFFIDLTPPLISITFPADGAVVQQNQVVVMGAASDNATAECGLSISVNGIPVVFEDGGQWLTTISLNEGETKIIEAVATDGSGNSSSYSISISQMANPVNFITVPISLTIYDQSPFPGNGNGVFENNESPAIIPSWANISGFPFYLTGIASNWSKLLGQENYTILNNDANYDTILNHYINNCFDNLNCYQLQITNHQQHMHLDAKLHEMLANNGVPDGYYDWPIHIGNSFSDVDPTNSSYKEIETLLHYGITAPCNVDQFTCSTSSNLTRGTLAMWLARALAMGEGNVPFDGIIPSTAIPEGIPWGCDGGVTWNSFFYDFSKD